MKEKVAFDAVSTPGEISKVAELAAIIWTEHYVPIIGSGQVRYMLKNFQSAEAIRRQCSGGISYYLIRRGTEQVGYLAYEKKGASLFLSKIYILESKRGMGVGKTAMEFVGRRARELGCTDITLSVNKYNDRSIKAYQRMGFKVKGAEITDIGGGFAMDDYRMVKAI